MVSEEDAKFEQWKELILREAEVNFEAQLKQREEAFKRFVKTEVQKVASKHALEDCIQKLQEQQTRLSRLEGETDSTIYRQVVEQILGGVRSLTDRCNALDAARANAGAAKSRHDQGEPSLHTPAQSSTATPGSVEAWSADRGNPGNPLASASTPLPMWHFPRSVSEVPSGTSLAAAAKAQGGVAFSGIDEEKPMQETSSSGSAKFLTPTRPGVGQASAAFVPAFGIAEGLLPPPMPALPLAGASSTPSRGKAVLSLNTALQQEDREAVATPASAQGTSLEANARPDPRFGGAAATPSFPPHMASAEWIEVEGRMMLKVSVVKGPRDLLGLSVIEEEDVEGVEGILLVQEIDAHGIIDQHNRREERTENRVSLRDRICFVNDVGYDCTRMMEECKASSLTFTIVRDATGACAASAADIVPGSPASFGGRRPTAVESSPLSAWRLRPDADAFVPSGPPPGLPNASPARGGTPKVWSRTRDPANVQQNETAVRRLFP